MLVTNKTLPGIWDREPCINSSITPIINTPPPVINPTPILTELEGTFIDSDLTVTGNLVINTTNKNIIIYDELGVRITPDDIDNTNENYLIVNLNSYRPLLYTWKYRAY